MRRVSASYNSPHIATNVHALRYKRFGQNCSTSSIRHVHDIHGEISVDSLRSCTSLYDTCTSNAMCTRRTRHSYDMCTSSCEFVRVPHDHSRVSTFKGDYYDMLRHLYEISMTMYTFRSTFHI